MGLTELLFLAVGLAMDAFAVAVCKGLAMERITIKKALTVGLWFGGFQGLMPLIGYFIGSRFAEYIEAYDHWVAFALLVVIGINMICESFSKDEDEESASLSFKTMLVLALATSIDALAVGISFACTPKLFGGIFFAVGAIAVLTCIISMIGVKIGNVFGTKYKNKAELAGGIILILIGLKLVIEEFV